MIEYIDIYYDSQYIFHKQDLKSILLNTYNSKPLAIRLKCIEELILEKVREVRKERMIKLETFVKRYPEHFFEIKEMARLLSIRESGLLYQSIKKFTHINYLKMYKILFQSKELFYQMSEGLELPDNIEDIILYTQDNFNSSLLMYEDTLALLFLKTQIEGCKKYTDIKQIIIDEAQDYYPIHFEILRSLFKNAKYTILGDVNQIIEKQESILFYDGIQSILQKKKSILVSMNKSFRCTNEIIKFSSRFIDKDNKLESFNRNGMPPKIIEIENGEIFPSVLLDEILECKKEGYNSIGILCKSVKETEYLYTKLVNKMDINLINENSNKEIKGVFIMPIYMSKGLEFDAVIMYGVNDDNYKTEDDKKILYIACTRALHKLIFFYNGEKSRFL